MIINKRILAVVVTYKGKVWYDKCFSSLMNSNVPIDVIAIDNASNDDTISYIKDKFPKVIVVENAQNLGFGRANNIGMRYALDNGYDYVFLLNQDAWIEKDTIEKLVEICEKDDGDKYGILGCINQTKEKDHILKNFLWTITDPKNCDPEIIDDMYYGRIKDVYDVKSILAAAWFLPRKTLEIVGGFDPIFFHYGEDDNYLQRVYYHGLKVVVCPKCPIVHDGKIADREFLKYKDKEYTMKKDWLVEWCNVNTAYKTNLSIVLFYKFLKSLCLFRFRISKYYIAKYMYYIENKNKVLISLSANKHIGSHYL